MVIPVLSWFRAAGRAVEASLTPQEDDWSRFQRIMREREQSPVTQWKGRARKDRQRIVHAALAANDGGQG